MDHAEQLWEIEQIKQLKARYFRLMDLKQWSEFRRVFTDDFQFIMETADPERPITKNGGDEFVRYLSCLALPTAVTTHYGHMPEIELSGPSTANGIWALHDWIDDPDNRRAFKGSGHYYDVYEKGADGQWRIKVLRLSRIRVDVCDYTELGKISRGIPTVKGA
jgi:hypothetical protein